MKTRYALSVAALLLIAAAASAQTISGTVHDDNGSLLRSMVVAAYNTAGTLQGNTTTDANGHYDLTLPAGAYRVLAYDNSGIYATQFSNDAPSFDESPLTTAASGQVVTVNFSLHRGITVSGLVLTSGGVRPGLTVAAYNLSGTRRSTTTTNADGTYAIVLPPGSFKLVAYDDAGAFAPSFFRDRTDFAEADLLTLVAGGPSPRADFFLQLGARLSGTVTDTSGRPIANASVLVYSADKFVSYATTAADGTFIMTVQPGSYRLVAVDNTFTFAAGYLAGATSFETSALIAANAGQFRSGLNFRLDRGGILAGSVLDAVTGGGIAGITVAAYNLDGTMRTFVTTDAKGQFALLLPGGSFRLAAFDSNLVYATQFYPQSASFARALSIGATVGQPTTLQPFTLSHGGRISGSVTDRTTHAPIAGATIVAYDSNGLAAGETDTTATGTYRFVLPGGAYRLVAFDSQHLYAPAYSGPSANFDQAVPVNVIVDAEARSDFALQRGTLVAGSVSDTSGRPLAGMQVTALDLDGRRVASAVTATDGTFQLSVAPGSYKLLATDPSSGYIASYLGGSTFVTASVFVVDATGAPRISIVLQGSTRRRAVHR